jgi:outer membrane protein TolC
MQKNLVLFLIQCFFLIVGSKAALALDSAEPHAHSSLELVQSEALAEKASVNKAKSQVWPELSFVTGYSEQNVKTDPKKGGLAYLNAEWSIYDGGRSWAEIKALNFRLELSQLQTERKKRELYFSSFKINLELKAIEEQVLIETKEVALYAQQLQAARKRVNSGVTSEADILELEIRQQETEEHILELNQQKVSLEAEQKLLNGGYQNAEYNLLKVPESAEKTLVLQEIRSQLEVIQAKEMGAYSSVLPQLSLAAQYGVISPQDFSNASKNESSINLLFKMPLFSGGKNLATMKALKSESLSADQRLRLLFQEKTATFNIKKFRLTELVRLIEVHAGLSERTQKFVTLVSSEVRRGIKSSGDWMDATEKYIDVQKKLVFLKTEKSLLEKELSLY